VKIKSVSPPPPKKKIFTNLKETQKPFLLPCLLLLSITTALRPLMKHKFTHTERVQDVHLTQSVNEVWEPRGINNTVWRRFEGQILMPSIGYDEDNEDNEDTLLRGFRKFLVHKPKELKCSSRYPKSYCAEIGAQIIHNAFSKIHKAIMHRAAEMAISHQGNRPSDHTAKKTNRHFICT
jgi:large subunit ribosomal protein L32e